MSGFAPRCPALSRLGAALLSGVVAWPAAGAPEEIVVTARKRAETLTDIPSAITALDEQALRARGLTELNQLEKFAPNVIQTNFGQGNTGHAAVFMRGIGLQDHIITTDPAVGIYLEWGVFGAQHGRQHGSDEHPAGGGVARAPGQPVRAQHHRRGVEHHHPKARGDGAARIDVKAGKPRAA